MSSLVVFQHSCRTPAMQCCCSPGPCLAALLPWLACFAMACMAFSYSDVLLGWHMYFSDFTKTKMQDDFLLPPPPPPHNLPAPPPLNPRRPINLLERPKYVGEQKTRLASQADCYGDTWDNSDNFVWERKIKLSLSSDRDAFHQFGLLYVFKLNIGSLKILMGSHSLLFHHLKSGQFDISNNT